MSGFKLFTSRFKRLNECYCSRRGQCGSVSTVAKLWKRKQFCWGPVVRITCLLCRTAIMLYEGTVLCRGTLWVILFLFVTRSTSQQLRGHRSDPSEWKMLSLRVISVGVSWREIFLSETPEVFISLSLSLSLSHVYSAYANISVSIYRMLLTSAFGDWIWTRDHWHKGNS